MYRFSYARALGWSPCIAAAVAFAGAVTPTLAAVNLTADPEVPTTALVETLDPLMFGPAQRGLAATRQLRQTFQNPNGFNVGEIVLSLDMNGTDGGLVVDFYEVADVNADAWAPLGEPIETISLDLSVDLPATADRLSLGLTESSVFTLPARNSGVEGYGIEVSNFDETSTIGLIWHSNSGADDFAGGRYYDENGGAPGGGLRDFGVWLLESTIEPPDPGDTNDDGIVDLDDLIPIRTNYFETVAARIDGDLNGDSLVDSVDFREWKNAFLGAGGSLSDVDLGFLTGAPEPTAAALLVVAGMAVCRSRVER